MITAFVPARSGSKRLVGKNIRRLAGKPLFSWTLEACLDSQEVERVIFSTDSIDYWHIARDLDTSGRLTLDLRTPHDAGDTVKIFDYLIDSCGKIFGESTGLFMLCLPTAPLRTSSHISEAARLASRSGRPVFSAVEYDFSTSFGFTIDDEGEWIPLFENSPMLTGHTRSQDQVSSYHPNGAIYIRDIADLRQRKIKTLYENALPYIMDRSASVDIDTLQDFRVAEFVLRNRSEW